MKINLSSKMVLGEMIALAAAGGVLTSGCIRNNQINELDEDSKILSELVVVYADSSKDYDPSIKAANEYFIKAREKEIADSIEFKNNPCRENLNKYKDSTKEANNYRKLINFLENGKAKLAAEEMNKAAAIKEYSDTL